MSAKVLFTWGILSLCLLGGRDLYGQNTVAAAGGQISAHSGTVSFTVGQIAVLAIESGSGKAQEGVQQPLDTSSETPVDAGIWMYPNPTVNASVNLKITLPNPETYTYQVADMNGKLLAKGSVKEQVSSISLSAIASAVYIIQVTGGGTTKTFKIIKK
ncbi:T9SS type A sorting domain-containing protein [Dawidia soli]|uniref:T9SS type A sorting domain-containing protein n=1 Tax=Dawidia soli TaxID=2782352 RepID=A0AAP2D8F8_9BACT|nr:T9SS type A sorting domain-containing protein [Dawidia soli]MBT1687189.1 T9SS type A sorting domain-containing protein [Dawidia soli]